MDDTRLKTKLDILEGLFKIPRYEVRDHQGQGLDDHPMPTSSESDHCYTILRTDTNEIALTISGPGTNCDSAIAAHTLCKIMNEHEGLGLLNASHIRIQPSVTLASIAYLKEHIPTIDRILASERVSTADKEILTYRMYDLIHCDKADVAMVEFYICRLKERLQVVVKELNHHEAVIPCTPEEDDERWWA